MQERHSFKNCHITAKITQVPQLRPKHLKMIQLLQYI
jgi:hypothetical protein